MIEKASYWDEEYEEEEEESCDYGFSEFCVGDKMLCEECWLMQEVDSALKEQEAQK